LEFVWYQAEIATSHSKDDPSMIRGDLRSKIDTLWNAFWAGGIANPIEVIEQITYLLFMKGLDSTRQNSSNSGAPRAPLSRCAGASSRRARTKEMVAPRRLAASNGC
jgi:hypothetical protein